MKYEASIKIGQHSTGWWFEVSAGGSSNRSFRHRSREDAFLAAIASLAKLLNSRGALSDECVQHVEVLEPPRLKPHEQPIGLPLEPSRRPSLQRERTTEVVKIREIRGLGWAP